MDGGRGPPARGTVDRPLEACNPHQRGTCNQTWRARLGVNAQAEEMGLSWEVGTSLRRSLELSAASVAALVPTRGSKERCAPMSEMGRLHRLACGGLLDRRCSKQLPMERALWRLHSQSSLTMLSDWGSASCWGGGLRRCPTSLLRQVYMYVYTSGPCPRLVQKLTSIGCLEVGR